MASPPPGRTFEDLRRTLERLGDRVELRAVATAPRAAPGRATVYCMKNAGTGKHQLLVQFPTGAAQVVATEP